jgi:TM2 domain-containing membrane protein YozV
MDLDADNRYHEGSIDYNVAWICLAYGGWIGLHRLYMRDYLVGIIYALTFGVFGLGWLYDFCTINEQITAKNIEEQRH